MSTQLQAQFDEAYARHEHGNLDRAEAGYKAVLKQRPDHAPSLYLLGLIAYARKQYKQAAHYYKQVLEITPHDADAYFEMANALQAQNQHEAALARIEKAIELDSRNSDYYCNQGLILRSLERHKEALASYEHGLALNPDDIDLWYNKGNTLRALKKEEEALKCYLRVWQKKPDHYDAWNNSGLALLELRQYAAALNAFEKAIAAKPDEAKFYWGVATALDHLNQPEKALYFYSKVRELTENPDSELSINALEGSALTLLSLCRNAEAEIGLREVIKARKIDKPSIEMFNLSLALLPQGKLQEGWPYYEFRLINDKKNSTENLAPRWDGMQSLSGKTILLQQEQGMGDLIQFCRYAKSLTIIGAQVHIETPAVLAELISTLGSDIYICITGEVPPAHDYYLPLLSAPLVLKTDLNNIPAQIPYLFPQTEKTEAWKNKLSTFKKTRIGISWSGNIQFSNDHKRSIPFEFVEQLKESFPSYDWFCIQKDIREYEKDALLNSEIIQLGEHFNNFSDTAAAIQNLDLVISVDTSLAHLAGALGKPVWIMLPYAADWRWLTDRNDSPWYPSARLFRQNIPGNWHEVIAQVGIALQETFSSSPQ